MEYIQTQFFNLESAVLSIAHSKVLVAKIATIWLLMQGILFSISPNFVARMYGDKKKLSPSDEKLVRLTYLTMIMTGIHSFYTIIMNYDQKIPREISWAIIVLEDLISVNKDPDTRDLPPFMKFRAYASGFCMFFILKFFLDENFSYFVYLLKLGLPAFFSTEKAIEDHDESIRRDSVTPLYMNRAGVVASTFGSYGLALWWFSSIEQEDILSLEKSIAAFGIFYATSTMLHMINILFKRNFHKQFEELVKINWNLIYMDMVLDFIFAYLLLCRSLVKQ